MKKEDLIKDIKDFRVFAKKYLKIKDKKGSVVPFIINTAQEIVLLEIERQISLRVPVRIIVLKARQKGISTLAEAYIFWRTTYRRNRKSAVIAHVRDATDNLWDMTNRYYKNVPSYLQPKLKHQNAKELSFELIESEMIFWTAETGDVGSSHTVQDLHASELSKWRDAKTSLVAVLQTIPDEPNTLVIMESTAKGFGDEFYNRWQMAKKKESNYVAIFLSWLIDDEYTLAFKSEEEKQLFMGTLDEIEQGLVAKGATPEHLNWRRKIGLPDKCGGDPDKFKEEYPSDDIEAFLTSGRPRFKTSVCKTNLDNSKEPLKVGYLEYTDEFKTAVRFTESPEGYVKLYAPPVVSPYEHYVYASGWDVSEGLEQGDYCVGKVLDRRTNNVILTWHGHIDPDLLATEQHKVNLYLGKKVYFCTEINNHGITVVNGAYKLNLNQYYREVFSTGTTVEKEILGFKTTGETRPFIINDLNEWIRDGLFTDYEKEFWEETLTFVINSKGKAQAQGKDKDPGIKCFDDRVLAAALMIKCHLWLPNYFREVEPEPDAAKIARKTEYSEESVSDYTF